MAWLDHIKRIRADYVLEYTETPWGDSICGTKEQLIRIGLGVGVEFPVGRGSVRTTDPRGYESKITCSSYMGAGVFNAAIPFPGRSRPREDNEYFAPGVLLKRGIWVDEYTGGDLALVNAGIVRLEVFPGQPGMGKNQVTLYPNGEVRHSRNGHDKRAPGSKRIRRVTKGEFIVSVRLDNETGEQRLYQDQQADEAWAKRMNALPRPPRLNPLSQEVLLNTRLDLAKGDGNFQSFLNNLGLKSS